MSVLISREIKLPFKSGIYAHYSHTLQVCGVTASASRNRLKHPEVPSRAFAILFLPLRAIFIFWALPLRGQAIRSYSSILSDLWGNRCYPLRKALKLSLFFIILLFILPSCITLDKCRRRYPPTESIIVRDSVITNTITVFKDSLVSFRLPADTITIIRREYIRDPLDPSLISIDTINAENDFSVALAWVHQSSLGLNLIQKDSTLWFLLDSAIRETAHFRELYHKEIHKQVESVRYIPKFYRFCSYFFFITITALIIFALVKLKKFLPFL
jgi:hypothetical protein